jgi:hypothetical protein
MSVSTDELLHAQVPISRQLQYSTALNGLYLPADGRIAPNRNVERQASGAQELIQAVG